jgi:DNA-binding CsgD family transcriptional regulator
LSAAEIALEFVGRCNANGDLPASIADFQRTIGSLGFTASACGAWVGAGTQRATRFFFIDWPQDWHDLYMSRGWLAQDFIVAEACRRMAPFCWDDVRAERVLSSAEEEVHAAARAYGWTDVFAVPVHGPAGYQGLVTMASKARGSLSPQDKAALHVMALTIHERCRSAVGFGNLDGPPVKLSKRELESMQWVAAGKTDWEISQLLGVTAATVHFHVERAKKKLDTKTRAQAVALLVLYGLV